MTQRLNYSQQSPEIFKKLVDLSTAVKQSSINAGLLHLIDIRVSQLNGCAFCLDMHVKEAKIHGERELRLHHLAIWRESPLFDARERAAFAWVEAVTLIANGGVSDQLYEATLKHFSEEELVKLTVAIGMINMWNRLSVSFHGIHPVERAEAA